MLLTALICLLVGWAAQSQVRIPGTHVAFDFPQNGWIYLKTINVDANTNVHLYIYTRETVIDSTGDTIIPFVRIFVKKDYSGSALGLAYSRYLQQPFQSLKEYSHGLPAKDGIGYIGAYTSLSDGKDYQFRMIYFKEKDIAFEFRAETTLSTYPQFEKIFEEIFNTIVIEKE